jgi:hypothetical protein
VELPDVIRVTLEATSILEDLQVPYLVGGSIASSLHGLPRSTLDSDLVADLRPQHAQPLCSALSGDFYIDSERVADAIRRQASFNVIHHHTGLKIDIFILKADPLARQEMARRQRIVPLPGESPEIPVASPEDIVLQKLHWYRLGNHTSERQWLDVLGVLKVQGKRLDLDYLQEWADRIGVDDLLRQAFEDAGINPRRD